MKVSNFINIKLFLISLSITIAYLYVTSSNNIVLRKKYKEKEDLNHYNIL
jgi:hypothetical protein